MDAAEKERQVREHCALQLEDRARSYAIAAPLLQEYGKFIAALAPWTHFVTLTHDPARLESGHTIVGHQRHRKQVRGWVFDDLRELDAGARWWSEEEKHKSGQCHEHGLAAFSAGAPVLSIRQRWFERCGYALVLPISSVQGVAEYVAKYTGKAATVEPMLAGFGLLPRTSFSRVLAGIR